MTCANAMKNGPYPEIEHEPYGRALWSHSSVATRPVWQAPHPMGHPA